MINIETGLFELDKGKKLYPGMTRSEFLQSFQDELAKKEEKDSLIFFLKPQHIDNFDLIINVIFRNDQIRKIVMQKPGYFNGKDLPTEKEADEVKKYHDQFLNSQLIGKYDEFFNLIGTTTWGSIRSIYDYSDLPIIKIEISYS